MTKRAIADDPGGWGWRPKGALKDILPAQLFQMPRKIRFEVYDDESGVHLATVNSRDKLMLQPGEFIVVRIEVK